MKIGLPGVGGASNELFGVYSGLYNKGKKSFDALTRGDILRAIEYGSPAVLENIMRATREGIKGATTPTGKVIYTATGKPLKLSTLESVAQSLGFRPTRASAETKIARTAQNVLSYYATRKENIQDKLRLGQNMNREIREYNKDAIKYEGAVPLITPPEAEPLVQVEHLTKHFPITRGILIQRQVGAVQAVDDISFVIGPGETLGLVGESGCGKTTVGRTLLGLYPATHRGIVAAVTPIVIPALSSRTLTAEQIKRIRSPFDVYQLDAVAYPGNSGSPVYDVHTGEVVGVINSVLVKKTKEAVLKEPSGISYAIPVSYVRELMAGNP